MRRPMRRRNPWIWVRGVNNNAAAISPPNIQTYDVLSTFRTTAGITLNIPEFTIWRIKIRISVQFGLSPDSMTASSGVLNTLLVEQIPTTAVPQTVPDPIVSPYNARWLMYDMFYVSEAIMNGLLLPTAAPAGTNVLSYSRFYDIKARRRLGNLNDTLWVVLQPTGNVAQITSSVTYSILLRQK